MRVTPTNGIDTTPTPLFTYYIQQGFLKRIYVVEKGRGVPPLIFNGIFNTVGVDARFCGFCVEKVSLGRHECNILEHRFVMI